MNTPPGRQNAVLGVCGRRRFFFLHITSSSEKETPKHIPGPFSGKKGRSIIGQDKEPPSCATAARPQSPAVRGFSRFGKRSRFWPDCIIPAVGSGGNARVSKAFSAVVRWAREKLSVCTQFSSGYLAGVVVCCVFAEKAKGDAQHGKAQSQWRGEYT